MKDHESVVAALIWSIVFCFSTDDSCCSAPLWLHHLIKNSLIPALKLPVCFPPGNLWNFADPMLVPHSGHMLKKSKVTRLTLFSPPGMDNNISSPLTGPLWTCQSSIAYLQTHKLLSLNKHCVTDTHRVGHWHTKTDNMELLQSY